MGAASSSQFWDCVCDPGPAPREAGTAPAAVVTKQPTASPTPAPTAQPAAAHDQSKDATDKAAKQAAADKAAADKAAADKVAANKAAADKAAADKAAADKAAAEKAAADKAAADKAAADKSAADKVHAEPAATASATSSSFVANTHIDSFGNLVDEHGGRVWPDAYYQARKDAEEHAQSRGKCFDDSKVAFAEDRKGEAKALSDEGKKHGELMVEANKRAVQVILGPQNLASSDKIDLHGLLVQEALDATKEFVLSCVGRKQTVEVITGQGLHSDKAKGPQIKPKIIEMCKQEGWQLDADENNPGSFTVHVQQRS
eukprot:m.63400 g.63400  ORF g.63400 m.63400 type:complete len:315 (+) comp49639_c0_seq2:65-1009(+)